MRRSYALCGELANPMSHREQEACLIGHLRMSVSLDDAKLDTRGKSTPRGVSIRGGEQRMSISGKTLQPVALCRPIDGQRPPTALALRQRELPGTRGREAR